MGLWTYIQDNLGEYVRGWPSCIFFPYYLLRIDTFQPSIEIDKNVDRNKERGPTVMNSEAKSEFTRFCTSSKCKQFCGGSPISEL